MLGGAIAGAAGADYAVDGYVADTTASATKTDLPIVRVPQMVAVITEEQLDDRNVQSLTEALTYSASARAGAFGLDPRFDSSTSAASTRPIRASSGTGCGTSPTASS